MTSKKHSKAKSLWKRLANATRPPSQSGPQNTGPSKNLFENRDPVSNYYEYRLKSNLAAFNHFAIQTRSLQIRETFALGASNGRATLAQLLEAIRQRELDRTQARKAPDLQASYNSNLLLALADLLANTARADLDTYNAALIYGFVLNVYGESRLHEKNKLQYVEALGEIGQYERAQYYARHFNINDHAPFQEELLNIQRLRSLEGDPNEAWLESLNDLYSNLNMTEIGVRHEADCALMDRLYSKAVTSVNGPKISVIMPTYAPGRSIYTAVRSLLEQTWTNLEIIIVDDASPANYDTLFSDLETLDPRIRVHRQAHNLGAYVARNAGLAQATGSYVTTHDDDDWSHPDKLALQVEVMETDASVVASTSSHIRTREDMTFQRVNVHAQYIQMNYSSLMFRRGITREIGDWDRVNRGGDSEFITRVIENFGEDRVVHVGDKPLSFSRVWSGSLTSGEMARGFFAYPRLLYRWSFRQWQWDANKSGKKPVRQSEDPRPYAVPSTFEAGQRGKNLGTFDVIYVTDFFRQSKFVEFVLADLDALAQAGYRVGYMHMYSPQTNKHTGFPRKLFSLQREGRITQVSHDDQASTRLVIVYDASIGMFLDEIRSSINTERGIVVEHRLSRLSGNEDRDPTLMTRSLYNLDKAFKTVFEIVGATHDDCTRLRTALPPRRLLAERFIWHPHVKTDRTKISLPLSKPRVGFHSSGSIYRWPSNKDLFKAVYLSANFTTRLYGQVKDAIDKFGEEAFQEIDILDPSDHTESDFLHSIDFWVYFPNRRLVDQVWKPVLDAMQAGKVVILPAHLKHIYDDSAVYAQPDEVENLVSSFVQDPSSYILQAERGRDFVATNFSNEKFVSRVDQLLRSKHR